MSLDLAVDLDLALGLADIADALTMPRFLQRSFSVEMKANRTEVTEVDRETESAIMDAIRSQRPSHAWYGEEHGTGGDDGAEFTWVVDPIDGTSNFVRGVPVYATLIGLVHRDLGPVLGVVSAPAMHTRWWGVLEGGAYCDGRPITVSKAAHLTDAHASVTINDAWRSDPRARNLDALTTAVARVRGFGDFWQHMLVAQGSLDVAVDAIGLEPYDIAALVPIVHAAGGKLTSLDGRDDWRANCAVSSNGRLHSSLIELLNA